MGSSEALSTDGGSITTNPAFRQTHQASFRSTVSDSEVEQGNVSQKIIENFLLFPDRYLNV